ncbi:hypothetical protein V1511DRAFT_108090 [Dipodascopsis uninucleata]
MELGYEDRVKLVPVTLKEAALDSPSFRTAAWHVNEQVENVERWIELYVKAGHRLSNDTDVLQESINVLLGRSFPNFITENIIDHDYTLTAMKSYSEGLRIFWSNFIKCVKGMEKNVIEQLETLQRKEMRQYKETRRLFESAQSKYDNLAARYASQSKSKESSSLREDAFQLYEARKQYVKISFDLCIVTVAFKRTLDRTIINAFSDQWIMIGHGVNMTNDNMYSRVADDMRRIRHWSDLMESSMKVFFRELNITRKNLESHVIAETAPPRELVEYSAYTVNPQVLQEQSASSPANPNAPSMGLHASTIDPLSVDPEKHGNLFLRTWAGKPARQVWVRRWVFVKDAMFGMLVQSPNKTYVEESDKIGVLLCNVKPSTIEDRRFCFEVTTKDTTLMFQAESQQGLISWLRTFEISKRKALEASDSRVTDRAFAIIPALQEFASTVQTSADAEFSHERYDSGHMRGSLDLSRSSSGPRKQSSTTPALQALISASQSIAGQHAISGQNYINGIDRMFDEIVVPTTTLAPTTIANNPLSTSMTKTAIAVHATTPPIKVPNGLTANTWGSVNWGARQSPNESLGVLKSSSPTIASPESGEVHASNEADEQQASLVGTTNPAIVIMGPDSNDNTLLSDDSVRTMYANRTYPSFYPYELKVQDAQLRTLFPGVGLDEEVVLVFRMVWSLKRGQQFSGRVYMTPKNIYLYANNGGMVFIRRRSLGDIVNVRGQTSENFDGFYTEFRDGSELSARTFLDNGKLIQYRVQFLVDNFNSPDPLPLEQLLQKLLEAKVNVSDPANDGWDDTPNPLIEEESGYTAGADIDDIRVSLDSELLSPSRVSNSNVTKYSTRGRTRDSESSRGFSGHGSRLNDPMAPRRTRVRLPQGPVELDFSKSMDKLVYTQEYPISAKALFHLLFGDKSTAFQKLYRGYGARELNQSPWIHLDGKSLERDFSFEISSRLITGVNYHRQVYCVQRIEKQDEYIAYVVQERRTPWNLPFADAFSQISRYVVTFVSKSSCRLNVWAATEWMYPRPVIKAIVQRAAIDDLTSDARVIGMIATSSLRQLGTKGRTSKAVQLFGQVGKSNVSVQLDTESAEAEPRIASEGGSLSNKDDQKQFYFSRKSFAQLVFESVLESVLTWVSNGFVAIFRLGRQLASLVDAHSFFLLIIAGSLIVNVFLGARSTVSYWTERRANKIMEQVGVRPNGILAKAVFLSDLEEYVSEGTQMAQEPQGLCYSKFRNFAEELKPESPLDFVSRAYTNPVTQDAAKRIWLAKQKAGVERHQHIVALKVITRMEEELVTAEWQNWLRSERIRCIELSTEIPDLNINSSEISNDLSLTIKDYCESCNMEWNALKL